MRTARDPGAPRQAPRCYQPTEDEPTHELPANLLQWVLIIVTPLVSLYTAGHALLYKRDPRAALGWIAVCLMFPLAGPLLYMFFGVNRVRTRARKLRRLTLPLEFYDERSEFVDSAEVSNVALPPDFAPLARIGDSVTGKPLVGGNHVEALHNGEEVYPAMLEVIEGARRSLYLTTYIFETNRTGRRFIEALAAAAKRGVDVRVLIDGIGELYSFPHAGRLLRKRGVRVARFMPPKLLPPTLHVNLRNHRKILVADGAIGFTGGMNIGDRHLAAEASRPDRVVDTHFRLAGPVVQQMALTFLDDWRFCTGEASVLETTLPPDAGDAICRVIDDGPNEEMDKLSMILVGAVSAARSRVVIMTPYFLPPREMIAALQSAALRGVEVALILPAKNNLPFVHWATRNLLWELLQRGVRVYYQPPPFVHTKVFLVDHAYVQVGSANLDPRSLRLNFELNVEVLDEAFARRIVAHVDQVRRQSHETTLAELDDRSLAVRLRDAFAWLFSPYM